MNCTSHSYRILKVANTEGLVELLSLRTQIFNTVWLNLLILIRLIFISRVAAILVVFTCFCKFILLIKLVIIHVVLWKLLINDFWEIFLLLLMYFSPLFIFSRLKLNLILNFIFPIHESLEVLIFHTLDLHQNKYRRYICKQRQIIVHINS